jgi:hypothetical protein
MRVPVGLIMLAAGMSGGAFLLLPSLEGRLGQSEADGVMEAEPAPVASNTRPVFMGQLLLASHRVSSALATTPPSSPEGQVTWTLVRDFGRNSSRAREGLPTTTSQAPPAARFGTTPPNRLTSSKPADGGARRELTKDLQRELKRVGCYEGEIDGSWGPESKRAMAAFTDRVNAALPVEEPDYILLALVQGHAAQTCGNSCPPGQELANGGRCMPRTIIARRARKDVGKAEPRNASDQQALADHSAAEAVMPHGALRAFKATDPSSDTGIESKDFAARTPPLERMAVGPASPATGALAPTAPAASRDVAATAGAKSPASDGAPLPRPKAKADRAARAYLGAAPPQPKSAVAQGQGMLPVVKKARSTERPRKGRVSVARAPLYRATPPANRPAGRYASRRALAAWWRQWQYAAYYNYYGGYGGMWGAWR